VVGVSDVKSGLYDEEGLDVPALEQHVRETGYLEGFAGAERIENRELLEQPCDVLIPAAVENQLTEENAGRLRCRMVVEGANGPTTLEADAILRERGIPVVPDVLANAGGVTVSYFEWLQGSQHFFWTEDEVNAKLIQLMQKAYREVHDCADRSDVDLRTAALMLGIRRIAEAKRRRGVFP
jgi:glutamate dehydrogenase/leucine dehydrogenase